ncbi:MAG: VapC toxin family PIN domain ribonuclease [Syntrophobacteraceae bacterium CG2_30_61_12]|nr:MAG: VapC toxin family PIN domain ribonuclease [Syntrophobacteraceae bacterium CG2_30_61_12]PIU31169.1 MAG: VapC toxin family PIN domain ribonuclease [Syntrophobacteraceae bacterium CG07_land_8_20_14_0_80_61_8]
MILVDSSVWIDYFSGIDSQETDRLDGVLGVSAVAIGDLILTEVLQGFRHDKDYKTARRLLGELTIFELLGTKMAVKSADNFRKLRKKGITIRKTADVIIASFCIEHNLSLLFSDRDFEPFVEHLGLSNAIYT